MAYAQNSPVLSVAGTAAATHPGGETTYQVELLNHTDQIVYDGVISITLPAGFTYIPGSTIALGEGWPLAQNEPTVDGQTLSWGPYALPAAGIQRHNPYGIHTLMNDCQDAPALHLEAAKQLVGNGGYVTQLFYGLDANTSGPSDCAVSFVNEAYARNLIPILRLQGHSVNGVWQAPTLGPQGDYAEIAQAFARYVAGLPRRDTNPLYIAIWNEPDLWIEWSGKPNAWQYARFFVAVSTAIKQLGDGRIRIVNGALTPGNPAFLERMLGVPGFKDAFDVWASHCYPYNHPPNYNNHARTARYGTYAIDCYLHETAIIKRYGRHNFKVMLTETGYELGNHTFGFEGFARINETNRARYIAGAFANYWQTWPEIVAVTPFQLGDTSGHWAKFDWLYPYPPYAKHLQFEHVARLPKPGGELKPYGFQVVFKVKVGPKVKLGTYFSELRGQARDGHVAYAPQAVPVEVLASGPVQWTYLPLILGGPRRDGPWYFSSAEAESPGAISPTMFLKPAEENRALAGLAAPSTIGLAGEPIHLAVAESAGLGAVLLADGRLEILDLAAQRSNGTFFVGDDLHAAATGHPDSTLYISSGSELVQANLRTGRVAKRIGGWGHLAGLAWDETTGQLFAANPAADKLLAFSSDLSRLQGSLALPCQPDQVILDYETRQLFLSCPATPQVLVVNPDSMRLTGQAPLSGGPILRLVFDANFRRLYALNALAPAYRGITVWQTPGLKQLALVAGAGSLPFQTASSLALTSEGQLLLTEQDGLWQINPADFTVSQTGLASTDDLLTQPGSKTIYLLDTTAQSLRIYQ